MGSPRRLKKKTELNYRHGPASGGCSQCKYFVKEFPYYAINPVRLIRHEPRCRIMGLENPAKYRIQPDYICDDFDNSEHLKRLRGY